MPEVLLPTFVVVLKHHVITAENLAKFLRTNTLLPSLYESKEMIT